MDLVSFFNFYKIADKRAEYTPAIYTPTEYLQFQHSSLLHILLFVGTCFLY